jgi:septation ring formation regulator EzrA
MRRLVGLVLVTLWITAAALPGAAQERPREQADGPAAPETTEGYRRGLETRLKDFGERLRELERRGRQAAEAQRPEIDRQLEALRARHEAVRERLRELGDDPRAAWEDARRWMDATVEELERAYRRTRDLIRDRR